MRKYFRSKEEFFDVLEAGRELIKKGAEEVIIHGSIVTGRGNNHTDVDIFGYNPGSRPRAGNYSTNYGPGRRSGELIDSTTSPYPFPDIFPVATRAVQPKRVVYRKK